VLKNALLKPTLLKQLCDHLQQEIDATMAAVNEAHALASHEQSKPENQYDTLALEAAYLAHGQSERIAELQRQVLLLNHFDFLDYKVESRISVGALVCIENQLEGQSKVQSEKQQSEKQQWLWILPVAGGIILQHESIDIRSITPEAPLAKALLGRYLDDEFTLRLGHTKKQFEIIELL
jgi:transcription elongation GreA/GreB family factor